MIDISAKLAEIHKVLNNAAASDTAFSADTESQHVRDRSAGLRSAFLAAGATSDAFAAMRAKWAAYLLDETYRSQPRVVREFVFYVRQSDFLREAKDVLPQLRVMRTSAKGDGAAMAVDADISKLAETRVLDTLLAGATWPGGLLTLSSQVVRRAGTSFAGRVSILGFVEDNPELDALVALLVKHQTRAPRLSIRHARTREVHLIEAGMEGLSLRTYALPGHARALVRANYSDRTIDDYDAVKSFCAGKGPKKASGGLVLIDGPPGTGKTHIIRGLIREVRAPFVIATGGTVANLASPGFIPFILRECQERAGLVLILEDADALLIKREYQQDTSVLSLLLNATSGIMGDLLSLRVIATVNTWEEDRVDPAVVRPGRLFRRLTVGPLTAEHAREVVLRETKGNEIAAQRVTSSMSLADAYALAQGGV